LGTLAHSLARSRLELDIKEETTMAAIAEEDFNEAAMHTLKR
jgi:hypothetical protein